MAITYMLDTNTVSYIAKGTSPVARKKLLALGEDETACISSITEAELRYGLAKRPEATQLRTAVEGLLFRLRTLPWDSEAAAAYGILRAQLESSGMMLSQLDLQIAAHAVAVGAILVTNDGAFSQIIDRKRLENWAHDV